MASLKDGINNALKSLTCALLSGANNILGGVAEIFGDDPTVIENTTKALRRLGGCDPTGDPAPPPPPFVGGQCAVLYNVSYTTEERDSTIFTCNAFSNPTTVTALIGGSPVLGPIGEPIEVLAAGGAGGSTDSNQEFRLSTGSGQRLLSLGGAGNRSYLGSCGPSYRITNFGVSRVDGLPDDCGSVSPVFPPATFIDVDVDVTYNIDDGTELTVNIPFIFAPIITDINGNFRFPFTFELGGIDFSGNLQLEPNFNVTINPPPAPRGTDSPITDLPGPDDEIPVEPSTFEERVVGVVVQSALVGEQQLTTIFTTDIPQILAPRCGSVKFGYAIAGRSFWSPDIDIKDLNCFIPCPFSQGADTVAASPAPGVVLNYVPIYGAPLATVADLGSTPVP